jgi:hypothetical protein
MGWGRLGCETASLSRWQPHQNAPGIEGVEAVSSAAKLKHRKYDRKGLYSCLVWSRPLVLPWTAVDGGTRKASNLSFTIE